MLMLIQLAFLLTIRADANSDYCSSMCGSAYNSPNPAEQYNKLLTSGVNCNNQPYSPLTSGGYNNYNQGNCLQNYGGDPYSQRPSYPQQPGPQQPGPMQPGPQQPGANEECELTSVVTCKPKGPSEQQPPYPQQPNGGNGGFRPPQQQCDCSQFGNGGGSSYGGNGSGSFVPPQQQCDCSQFGNGGGSSYGGNGSGSFVPPQPQQRPTICNSSGVGPSPYNKMRNPQSIGEINCNSMATQPILGFPPTKMITVGTTELPAAEGFTASQTSCAPPANGSCP